VVAVAVLEQVEIIQADQTGEMEEREFPILYLDLHYFILEVEQERVVLEV